MSGHNAIKVLQVLLGRGGGKSPNPTHLQSRLRNLFRKKNRKQKTQQRIKFPLGTVAILCAAALVSQGVQEGAGDRTMPWSQPGDRTMLW